jgi:hypothetical protein
MRWYHWIAVVLYLLFGAYLINEFVEFIKIPEIVSNYNNFIYLFSGAFLVYGAFNYYLAYRFNR